MLFQRMGYTQFSIDAELCREAHEEVGLTMPLGKKFSGFDSALTAGARADQIM